MTNFNAKNFLDGLNEEQRQAVLACKTEEEFQQVMDEFDIQIPDEMLETVTGGKGFAAVAMAAILAFTGAGATIAVTANTMSVSVSAAGNDTAIDEIMENADNDFKDCVQDFKKLLQVFYHYDYRNHIVDDSVSVIDAIKNIKIDCNGVQRSIGSVVRIFDYDDGELLILCNDYSTLHSIESAFKQLYLNSLRKIDVDALEIEIDLEYPDDCEMGNALIKQYDNVCKSLEELSYKTNDKILKVYKNSNMSNNEYKTAQENLRKLADKYIDMAKNIIIERGSEIHINLQL